MRKHTPQNEQHKKSAIQSINSTVRIVDSAVNFLPTNINRTPAYQVSFGAIAAITGAASIGAALFRDDAFEKGNKLKTLILATIGLTSMLQGINKARQAYSDDFVED